MHLDIIRTTMMFFDDRWQRTGGHAYTQAPETDPCGNNNNNNDIQYL